MDNLKREYNAALTRFHNMEEWCRTASIEEQFEYEDEIYAVIDRVSELYNILREKKAISSVEILRGFEI